MEFTIDPVIFERFPGMTIVAIVAGGIDNRSERPEVDAFWAGAWQAAHVEANRYESAQAHPRVAPWRAAFRAMGLAPRDFRSSIEALTRRAIRGDALFRISPLVDFYNAVSIRHLIPVGGFDPDDMPPGAPVELRLTRSGDTYQALDSATEERLPPGEVAYVAGNVTLTRHFVWRQSQAGMVRPETTRAFLVAEALEPVGRAAAEALRADFVAGLERFFDAEADAFILDADHLSISAP